MPKANRKNILEEYNLNMENLKHYRKTFEIHKGEKHKWNFASDEEFLVKLGYKCIRNMV